MYVTKKSSELGLIEAKESRRKKSKGFLDSGGGGQYFETAMYEFIVIFYEILDVTLNAFKNCCKNKVIEQLAVFDNFLVGKN